MNVLVIGSNGMIGNAIFSLLNKQGDFNVFGSLRNKTTTYKELGYINNNQIIELDPLNLRITEYKIKILKPDLVINCIGIKSDTSDKRLT